MTNTWKNAMETPQTRLPDNELQEMADSFDRQHDYSQQRAEQRQDNGNN